ncbi:MAG TPA: hypothetical protein VHZ96_10205 [Frankiaceae bacterium]|jgi:hypothetical protein|nr:hypothetical protein [Frankiaceae bacterium]
MGAAAAPRLDFRRELRQRLVDEALLIAAQPKTRPRSGRPRRPKGGGIKLAAIGIGFSLAGGGIVAAAHSFNVPARANSTAPATAAPRLSSPAPHDRGPAPPPSGAPASESAAGASSVAWTSSVQPVAAPTSATAADPTASPSPVSAASTLAAATQAPSAAASAIGQLAGGRFPSTLPSDPPSLPALVPSWFDPLPSVSAGPLSLQSPLR